MRVEHQWGSNFLDALAVCVCVFLLLYESFYPRIERIDAESAVLDAGRTEIHTLICRRIQRIVNKAARNSAGFFSACCWFVGMRHMYPEICEYIFHLSADEASVPMRRHCSNRLGCFCR